MSDRGSSTSPTPAVSIVASVTTRWSAAAMRATISKAVVRGQGQQRPYLRPVDRFVVRPGGPLAGTVRVGGAKNSALKLMAACLLAEGRYTLSNVPRISDVDTMSDVLAAMRVGVRRTGDDVLTIDTPATLTPEAPYELVERMRPSVVVL